VPENSCRFAIGGKANRFEHIPLRKLPLDWADIAPEALQDFGNDDT
jgi:hypothetical protein